MHIISAQCILCVYGCNMFHVVSQCNVVWCSMQICRSVRGNLKLGGKCAGLGLGLHYTIVWPQQTVRSSCWSSHRMGISLQPTHKRFNSAYLQNEFVIRRKFKWYLWTIRNFFLLIKSHHDVLIKEIHLKQKNRTQIFNYGPARQARQKIKMSSYWKFIEVTHLRNSGRGRGIGVINILLKLFFFELPDLVHRRTAAPVAAENRRWMALQTS